MVEPVTQPISGNAVPILVARNLPEPSIPASSSCSEQEMKASMVLRTSVDALTIR